MRLRRYHASPSSRFDTVYRYLACFRHRCDVTIHDLYHDVITQGSCKHDENAKTTGILHTVQIKHQQKFVYINRRNIIRKPAKSIWDDHNSVLLKNEFPRKRRENMHIDCCPKWSCDRYWKKYRNTDISREHRHFFRETSIAISIYLSYWRDCIHVVMYMVHLPLSWESSHQLIPTSQKVVSKAPTSEQLANPTCAPPPRAVSKPNLQSPPSPPIQYHHHHHPHRKGRECSLLQKLHGIQELIIIGVWHLLYVPLRDWFSLELSCSKASQNIGNCKIIFKKSLKSNYK